MVSSATTEMIKQRLSKDRPMTSISLRVPQDVIDDLRKIAPALGFSGYQSLMKTYIGQGLRKDMERLRGSQVEELTQSLRKQGVSEEVISMAMEEAKLRTYTGHVMENDLAIKAQNFINRIIANTGFIARAKNLGIGTPQVEVISATSDLPFDYFIVKLSEQDRLLSGSEQEELFLSALVDASETLKVEENRQKFRQFKNIVR